MTTSPPKQAIRAAEVIAATCLATDLGMGFPFEHGLHATLMSMRLADLVGVDSETAAETYYACLLMYAGCTTDAEINTRIFAGGLTRNITHVQFGSGLESLAGVIRALPSPHAALPRRVYQTVTRLPQAARFRRPHFTALCEVASMLAERLGLPPRVHGMFAHLTERWDGQGILKRAEADEIPLPLRIVHVARDAAYQRLVGGDDHAAAVVRERGGHAFDPAIAKLFYDNASEIMAADTAESVWESTLSAEPRPWLMLKGEAIDRALAAMGDFADLGSPTLAGHSSGVADLARNAAELGGFHPDEVSRVGRAALLHDVGRSAVSPRIWQKAGPLTADEREQVRLHAYQTERVLVRSPFLADLAAVACAHHERLDGSGYHRAATASSLSPLARLVAAADALRAMTEPRAHRPALSLEEAAKVLKSEVAGGRQDPEMVSAVLEASGQPALRLERPAGLTDREAEVIGLLARGLQTKQVAHALDISAKTADRHIQNAYRKIGVSTRAAATLFASEHGLVPWGEFPISQ